MAVLETGIQILVIEESPEDYALIQEYLHEEAENPAIEHIKTYADAKHYLTQSHSYDVILLDLDLPDASGETLVKNIMEISGKVPVIVLTDYENKQFGLKTLNIGVADYLLKDELNPFLLSKSISYSIERNRINQSLRESEKQYRDLFDLSPLPKWVYDRETLKFLDVNQQAIDYYGYSRDEFLSMTIKDIRPQEEVPKLELALNEQLNSTGLYKSGIHRHQKKNGDLIHVDIRSKKIDYNNRKAKMVVANDVTEQKYYADLEKLERDILGKNALGEYNFKTLIKEFVLGIEKLHPGAKCSIM